MKLCFFGAYDPDYPRNAIIRKGLRSNGMEVSECWLAPKYKFWLRYPILFFRSRRFHGMDDFFFVPEFCQKDVPLARILSFLATNKVIFDPLASRYETKIMDWKRNPPNSWQAWWNFKIDYWSFKLSDLVLADTRVHKEYYCQKYDLPSEKVEVLPVGFDSDLFKHNLRKASGEEKKHFIVLFFGSFLPLHGIETIVSSAKIILREDASIKFRLVGSGQTLPKAQALVSNLGLNNVRFESWVPQSVLPLNIASADICLGIFGKSEKTKRVVPHKIFQAMAMKKPVITLRTPAVEELFSHRKHIFFCPSPNPSNLARAILELKKDSFLREEIGERGYRLVSQKFSQKAIGRMLIDILERNFGPSSGRAAN